MSDEEEYQVEEILDHQIKRGKHLYLIKWEGYGSDSNTWEPLGEQLETERNPMKIEMRLNR